MEVLVAVTGASGAVYAEALLRALSTDTVHLVVSENGMKVMQYETGLDSEALHTMAAHVYRNGDLTAPPASGSFPAHAMVIIPCSMNTLSKVAVGISDNLITRAASVFLKEGKRLVLVPRETPLSAIHLSAMHTVAAAGAVVLPACPGFYFRPESIDDLVGFVVDKVLQALGKEPSRRWMPNQKDPP